MSGSVEQVRDGIYRVRVYVGKVDGKEQVRSKTFPASNLRDAKKKANGHVDAILAGEQERIGKRGTVEGLVNKWLTYQAGLGDERSITTMYRLQSITGRIVEHLGAIQARELSPDDIDGFYASLRRIVVSKGPPVKRMSESTVHHYFRVLRSILNYGEVRGHTDIVMTRRASRPKPVKYRVKLLDDAQMNALFDSAPPDIKLPVKVDLFLGLRRGELFGLRWSDLRNGIAYIENNRVTVPGQSMDKLPKGRRGREVPMVEEIQHDLAALRARQEEAAALLGVKLAKDARVLCDLQADPTGMTPMSPEWLSGAWKRHCRRQGVNVRLHDCRHWCASRMLARGVPMKTVQEIMGHQSVQVTMDLYGHTLEDSHDTARAALATALPLFALNP